MKRFFTLGADNGDPIKRPDSPAEGGSDTKSNQPGGTSFPDYGTARPRRGEFIATAIVLVGGAIALTWLSIHVTDPNNAMPKEDRRGANAVVRSEAMGIFIPPAFIELAKNRSEVALLKSNEDIKACLQRRGLEKSWYAIIYHDHLLNGKITLTPIYCWPSKATWKPWEFRAVLDTSQGDPPVYPDVDFTNAKVSIIAQELANTDPGLAISELIRQWDAIELRQERKDEPNRQEPRPPLEHAAARESDTDSLSE